MPRVTRSQARSSGSLGGSTHPPTSRLPNATSLGSSPTSVSESDESTTISNTNNIAHSPSGSLPPTSTTTVDNITEYAEALLIEKDVMQDTIKNLELKLLRASEQGEQLRATVADQAVYITRLKTEVELWEEHDCYACLPILPKDVDDLNSAIAELTGEKEVLRDEIEHLEARLVDADEEGSELRDAVMEREVDIQNLEKRLHDAQDSLADEIERLGAELVEADEAGSDLRDAVMEREVDIQNLEKRLHDAQDDLAYQRKIAKEKHLFTENEVQGLKLELQAAKSQLASQASDMRKRKRVDDDGETSSCVRTALTDPETGTPIRAAPEEECE